MAPGDPGIEKSQNNKKKKKTLQFRKKELQKFTKVVLGHVKSTEKAQVHKSTQVHRYRKSTQKH